MLLLDDQVIYLLYSTFNMMKNIYIITMKMICRWSSFGNSALDLKAEADRVQSFIT